MGLLNPLNLLYLASLGVLVLIYLRARSRPTLEVSSLMLFDEVAAPVASARLLRVDLMFWLEVLALGALSMAAAGLYLKMPAAPEHIRRHALVFDLGAAMGAREGGRSRLDRARSQARAIIADAPAGDAFSVIGYALEARILRAPSANRQMVRESVAALKPFALPARPAALSAALMRAREADTIDLYADRLPPGGMLAEAGVSDRLRFHRVGSPADNLAIVSIDPGTVRVSPGNCVVRNFSSRPRLCELAIESAGERIARPTVMIEPRGQVVVPFGPLDRGGLVSARILSDDALAADNERWAYALSDEPAKVLLVSPDPAVRDDLARVLLAVNQNFIITAFDSGKFKIGDQPAGLALAVMHDFYDSRVKAPSRLFIYPPASPSSDFDLKAAVPIAELRERAGEGELLRPMLLGPARVFALPAWMEVLAGGSAADSAETIPLAAFGRDRDGAVGLVAFDLRDHLLLDPDRLDALTLTLDLVKQLVARDDLQIVATGSWVTAPAAGAARIVAPDGAIQNARPDVYGRIRFRALQAGRYSIESPGRSTEVFANYFDAAESDLAATTAAPAESGSAVVAATHVAPGSSEIRPLDIALVALALMAFLIESAIILRNVAGWRWSRV